MGGHGTATERFSRLCDCRSERDVLDAICDSGIAPNFRRSNDPTVSVSSEISAALNMALDHAASVLRAASPVAGYYDLLLYKYDYCNLKIAIKAFFGSPVSEPEFIDCGSIEADKIRSAVSKNDLKSLPHDMAEAASAAISSYRSLGEARTIDFIVDKAYFRVLRGKCVETGDPFFIEYAKASADITNIRTLTRISAASLPSAGAAVLFSRAFVEGGSLPEDKLTSLSAENATLYDIGEALPLSKLRFAVKNAADENDTSLLDSYISEHAIGSDDSRSAFSAKAPAIFFLSREEEIRRYRRAAVAVARGNPNRDELISRIGGNISWLKYV